MPDMLLKPTVRVKIAPYISPVPELSTQRLSSLCNHPADHARTPPSAKAHREAKVDRRNLTLFFCTKMCVGALGSSECGAGSAVRGGAR
jgi:hypothetical protein